MTAVFLIPARSGSTRIKNKNLKKINNKSILVNKIENCLMSNIGDVFVSTDSIKIANISKKNGAKILGIRPKKLSTSNSSMLSVVINFLEEYKKKFHKIPSFLIIAPATNPFLNFKSIKKALNILKRKKQFNSIVSIYRSNEQPFQLIDLKNKKARFGIFNFGKKNYFSFERSQDVPKFYKFSSALQITKAKYFCKYLKIKSKFQKDKPFDAKKCLGYVINSFETTDINTMPDYNIIKKLSNKKKILKTIMLNYL